MDRQLNRRFARVWLLAMIIASMIAGGVNAYDGGPWIPFIGSLILTGAIGWTVWFIVIFTMPWIERD